ncbi:MAG: radical SAM protein [Deltaproteobacteria bacterium]|nr:radical SAM protein [Deltaproteobacteria bacterium]
MKVACISPPPLKPSEPGLSAPAAAKVLCELGVEALAIDAAIGWHAFALAPERLDLCLEHRRAHGASHTELATLRRSKSSLALRPALLRLPETYRDRRRYSSAISHLENGLRLAAAPFPDLKLGVGTIAGTAPNARPESSAWLAAFAAAPGPFDAYFTEVLIPRLRDERATHVAVSVTFQAQAAAAFRFAVFARDHLPGVTRILGGPLVSCLHAVGIQTDREPFTLFDRVVGGSDADLRQLAREALAAPVAGGAVGPLSAPLALCAADAYLAPEPIIPAALGRGCYWRHCTFCPERLMATRTARGMGGIEAWLQGVAARFPRGSMLHLTDAALPVDELLRIAAVIARDRLPIRWHGFVRLEAELAQAEVAAALAAGGCVMLQLGVETGSPRLLSLLAKGGSPELARQVLRTTAAAGIKNEVYLLFGLPTETDADREATLALVEAEAESIHAVNPALLNLPRGSAMQRAPARFGITEIRPFHPATDLSLYDDFRCGARHPRLEARRYLARRFFKSRAVRALGVDLRSPLKANHLCFLLADAERRA